METLTILFNKINKAHASDLKNCLPKVKFALRKKEGVVELLQELIRAQQLKRYVLMCKDSLTVQEQLLFINSIKIVLLATNNMDLLFALTLEML